MPRAARICSQPGCPAKATGYGKCAKHKPVFVNPTPWAGRTPVPKGHAAWRRQVLARDGHTCRRCGAPATEADHIINRATRPDLATDPDNGQALCRSCHRAKTLAEAAAGRAARP